MQECITLCVFTVIAYLLFREPIRWNNLVSYAFIVAAGYFAFAGERKEVLAEGSAPAGADAARRRSEVQP